MNRRIRFLAALLALFAFSAFLAEEVWASMCGPDGSGAGVHAVMEHAPATDPHGAECHEDAGEAPGAPASPDAPDCPLMLFAGAGCASVTLAGQSTSLAPFSTTDSLLRPVDLDRLHDLVVIHGLFRPPIA
jgi:hypothetical protein